MALPEDSTPCSTQIIMINKSGAENHHVIAEVNAVNFRQNLGEMLNQVEHRNDSIVIHKDGKPVAALVDAELFARIRHMRERFDALSDRVADAYADVPVDKGLAEIDATVEQERRRNGQSQCRARHECVDIWFGYPRSVPGRIIEAWHQGGLDVVLSRYILNEMVRVLTRLPRVHLSPGEVQDLADSYLFLADIVEPDAKLDPLLRDPKDQAILGTLRASRADYLTTGDKDLLALADRYPIVTPSAFWERHGG